MNNLVDVDVILHYETDKAWLVSDDGDRANAVWVPKSQAELAPKNKFWVLTMLEWLATEKGLV